MKKFLSIFFSILFVIFGVCTTNLSYASENNGENTSSTITEKLSSKEESTIKKSFNLSDKQFNGIRTIVDHPFAIILRAGGWGTLGALISLIPFINIAVSTAATIGAVCGAVSKMLDLYVDGYENGYKKY